MAGVSLRDVAELMGHRTIQMTMRYSHLAPDHLKQAVNRLVATGKQTAIKTATQASGKKAVKTVTAKKPLRKRGSQ
jgi:hypothetical protein